MTSTMRMATAHPVTKANQPLVRSFPRPLLVTEVVLALTTFLLAIIVKLHPGPLPGDLGGAVALQHLIGRTGVIATVLDVLSTITWPAYVAVELAFTVVLLALLRRWLDLGLILVITGAANGSNLIISQLVRRPRPIGSGLHVEQVITQYFSFPSGHVTHVVVFLGFLVFLTFQVKGRHAWLWLIRIALLAPMLLIGPARVFQGEHWPSDVVAGLLWGTFWLMVAVQVYRWTVERWPVLVPAGERSKSFAVPTPGAATPSAQSDA